MHFKDEVESIQVKFLFKLADLAPYKESDDSPEANQMVKELREFIEESQYKVFDGKIDFDFNRFDKLKVNQMLKEMYQKKGSNISSLDKSFWEATNL